jgi:histidyl-tRNA synthetase
MVKKENEKIKKTPQLLRGMKDILPDEQKYWRFINESVRSIAETYSYSRIDTPVLEEASLFIRSVGKDTDVVEKEMYTFQDRSGDSIAMRPEGTAGVVRAYLEHGMISWPQPVKLYYFGPFFRHDRPQAGRYRQFYQFGFEVLGDNHPVIDAQLMMMAYKLYTNMGVPVSLQVNSIGCPNCRPNYLKALTEYYRSRKNTLCEDCKRRFLKNPLRLLDCKEKDCQLLLQDAPQTVDYLCETCNSHFVKVLEHLDSLEIPYILNARLVRGLDYYSNTAFELWTLPGSTPPPAEGITAPAEQQPVVGSSALGGGGRYDYLAKQLGGQHTPAIGFASGVERLIIELKNRDIKVAEADKADIFVAQLGDSARKKAIRLFEELRQVGVKVTESFSKDGIKSQMELANKRGVKYALIIGQKELMDDTILIRDMENGIQETVDSKKIIPEIKKRLEKNGVVAVNNHTQPIHTEIHSNNTPPL